MPKIYIDTEECVGCESCVEVCPEVFGFDEETEKATVLKEDNVDSDSIDEAIEICPTGCIHKKE